MAWTPFTRRHHDRSGMRYASDLTDREWSNIGTRNSGHDRNGDYWSSLINRLFELLDGAAKTRGVIIVGATNRPEKIDAALLRSGRLETIEPHKQA